MAFCVSSNDHTDLASPPPPANPKQDISIQVTNPPEPPHHADLCTNPPSSTDYLARANWLRAAVLGANDGLVSVASLMIGVGAVNQTSKAMLVSGLAGLVAGACSMAIGEFVSVYAQYDIELANQMERGIRVKDEGGERLPSPMQAAMASALAFALGGVLPLLAGGFVAAWGLRLGLVCGVTSLGLAGFGAAGGLLGGSPFHRSALRVLVGGWLAMLLTYGVLRLFGLAFKMQASSAY